MVNIPKIKELAKKKGIKIGFLCSEVGMKDTYLADVARGKNSMSDDRIMIIADILGTSYEYLTDQTDDPAPTEDFLLKSATSLREKIQLEMVEKVQRMTDEQLEVLGSMLNQSPEEFAKTIAVLKAMQGK